MTTAEQRVGFRWRTYPRAVIATVIAAVFIVTFTANEEEPLADQYGGDMTVYYSAGNIVRSGDGELLYDLDRQAESQRGFWENEDSRILYAYPPVVAAVYAPLSALGYQWLYLIHTLAMVGALMLSAHLLGSLIPWMANPTWRLAGLAYAFTFLPLFVGSFVGQNTALLLLGLVSVWWGLKHDNDVVAGIAAALLLLKPQYGVPIVGLLFLARRWRAFGSAMVATGVLWALSVLVSGPNWVANWWEVVSSLSTIDQGANLTREVSILGLAENVLGSGSSVALAIWVIGVIAVVAAVLWRLRERPLLDPHALALVPPMMLLIAPHALYYDAGALLISLAILWPTVPESRRLLTAIVWFAGGVAYLLHEPLGVQPVALLVFATFAWAWWASTPGRRLAPTRHLEPSEP